MAAVALEDIWDAPLTQSPPRATSIPAYQDGGDEAGPSAPRASKRPRSTLFFDSDSEGEAAKRPARRAPPPLVNKSEIDAMFDNLDDEPNVELPAALDIDALRRQEDAKHAKKYPKASPLDVTNGSASTKGKSGADAQAAKEETEKAKRKPLPKLDEARLLSPDGFPALVKQAKNFKPRGKGHEASDLNRLLQVYQFWTHKLYPKMQFRDTVRQVEKLCHSKRMHVALGVWRDEAKGLINGRKPESVGDAEESDAEDSGMNERPLTSQDALMDEGSHSSREPSRPPSSPEPASSDAEQMDDFDIDAVIAEEEERRRKEAAAAQSLPAPLPSVYQPKPNANTNAMEEDDEAMWDELMGDLPDEIVTGSSDMLASNASTSKSQPRPEPDEDEDMWDALREMEAEEAGRKRVKQTPAVEAPPARGCDESGAPDAAVTVISNRPTNEDGWDEMYL
ncbi:Swi3-domain-containing protein [Wolfiporia cocos MD-104 SS10]|uniref:Chromosome segregation in meiosis protein n=1 Tax=Wolfiporia cocos (strain MD-104) TaxID=742152 RepID=A0A2H3J6Y1_WOLCO|nr:Swi3-domain-containing protein [Wolfiporia cocos MD-104 SS10]